MIFSGSTNGCSFKYVIVDSISLTKSHIPVFRNSPSLFPTPRLSKRSVTTPSPAITCAKSLYMFASSFSGTIVPSRSISPDPAIMTTAAYFPSAFGFVIVPCKVNSLLIATSYSSKVIILSPYSFISNLNFKLVIIFLYSLTSFIGAKTGFSAILCNMLRFIISSFLTVLAPSGNSANHPSIASK
ncbi:hypothetical protein protein [Bacillus cereus G9241]|nr:hypothetical protein protein [Bacillus cereus G9241]